MTGSANRGFTVVGMVVALAATGTLVITGGPAESSKPVVAGGVARTPAIAATAAWPGARTAVFADLPLLPLLFLDTATVVGVEPTEDDRHLRLVLRNADGSVRELRRLVRDEAPRFENLITAGDDVVWTEFNDGRPPEIWAANVRPGRPARRLTADTGGTVFLDSPHELVHHDGRVYWTAIPDDTTTAMTEVRSVALSGGAVGVTRQPGEWTMAPWPWLDDGAGDGAGASLMRDTSTGRDVTVPSSSGEFPACSPVWCRVLVLGDDGLQRIDLMRPDGSERRQIAGRDVRTAVPDVAVLDRFELLAELTTGSDAAGTARLLAYDIRSGKTVELAAAANDTRSRNGLVWWYSGDAGATRWHVVDLRTV